MGGRVATRKRTMDMVATDRLLAAGMHMHFPGFLNLNRRADGGYDLIPEIWIRHSNCSLLVAFSYGKPVSTFRKCSARVRHSRSAQTRIAVRGRAAVDGPVWRNLKA